MALRLTATSDATGHINLEVTMRNYSDPADWRLQGSLMLEAGQLEEVARVIQKAFWQITG